MSASFIYYIVVVVGVAGMLCSLFSCAPVRAEPDAGQEQSAAAGKAVAVESRSRANLVAPLLEQAESALARGKLTQPAHANAYDRYRAVLLLDPGNEQAQSGLRAVRLAYASMIRDALHAGRISEARQLWQRMASAFPGEALLDELQQEIKRTAQALVQQAPPPEPEEANVTRLPPQALAQRDETVKTVLTDLAEQVAARDASVLIRARSDAEARWIYQVMNGAVEGYRIRGNVQIDSRPAVQLLEPLP